jgi:hypothetical protein
MGIEIDDDTLAHMIKKWDFFNLSYGAGNYKVILFPNVMSGTKQQLIFFKVPESIGLIKKYNFIKISATVSGSVLEIKSFFLYESKLHKLERLFLRFEGGGDNH